LALKQRRADIASIRELKTKQSDASLINDAKHVVDRKDQLLDSEVDSLK
jgi:hypothetical protein